MHSTMGAGDATGAVVKRKTKQKETGRPNTTRMPNQTKRLALDVHSIGCFVGGHHDTLYLKLALSLPNTWT